MHRYRVIFLAFCAAIVAGCSLHKAPSVEDYYAQGDLMFAQGNYNNAIENYQHLIDEFPFSPYAEDAELKIGLAYYREQEYGEAVSALNDFQRMHPTNQSLHLASYYLAMSYFDQIGRADQDQTATVNAMHQFQALEQRPGRVCSSPHTSRFKSALNSGEAKRAVASSTLPLNRQRT